MSKQIHVAWPTLCKIELEDAQRKMERVLEMVCYPDEQNPVARAMRLAISSLEDAQEAIEWAYGK